MVATCGLLLLAVTLVFGQTVYFEFVNLDDASNVYMNPHVTGGVTAQEVKWALTERYHGAWMPLTWISHMLNCQVYGLEAGGHHLTNVLLHAATAVLLFLVLRQMTRRLWPSAFLAAIFAVHPLRAESVAWVTERKDVLSGLFFMLALGAYVWYARRRFSIVRYMAVVISFAMGLMAKPMLVTLPFVLLLLDYWPLGRWTSPTTRGSPTNADAAIADAGSLPEPGSRRASRPAPRGQLGIATRLVLEKVPLLALTVTSCALNIWSNANLGVDLPEQRSTFWSRIDNAPVAYVSYLGMFFYPAKLAVFYPRPSLDAPLLEVFAAVVVLIAITSVAWVMRRKHPYLLVGWLWYLGMLVPASGAYKFGLQTLCDRFTYLPQIGLCVALVWALADASRSWPLRPAACGLLAAAILAALMGCAWRQTSFWHDDVTLWTHTLECTSRNRFAHHGLGNAYLALGEMEKAIDQYRAAIAIEPNYAMSHYNLGIALASVGRLDEAIAEYAKVIELQPDNAEAHNNLGNALSMQGRWGEAIAEYQKVVDLQPASAVAHNNLGHALAIQGRLAWAMFHCQEALKIDPTFAEAHYNVGNIWYCRRRFEEAINAYQKALETNPDLAMAHYPLGRALAERGRLDEAIAEYGKALETTSELAADVHNSLGLALAARGRPDEAALHFRSALAIRPNFFDARQHLDSVSP